MSKQDNGPRYARGHNSVWDTISKAYVCETTNDDTAERIAAALNAYNGVEATIAERQGIIDELRRERNNVDRAILRVYAKCEASESEVHSPMGMLDIIGKTIDGTSAACEDLQAEIARLRDVLAKIASQKPEKPDHYTACSQCEGNASMCDDALNTESED